MDLKSFAQGHYDDGSYVIKGVERNKYSILSRYQHYLFSQLLERKHPLFVLFQPTGICSLAHFRTCFELIRKLVDLGLVENAKGEIAPEAPKSRLEGMHAAAEWIIGRWLKVAQRLGPRFWIVAIGLLATFGLISYVWLYELIDDNDKQFGFPFFSASIWTFVAISISLSWRGLVRAAFLRAYNREVERPRFEFWGPFLYLEVGARDIWLEGITARVGLAFVGLLAPLSLIGVLGIINIFCFVSPMVAVIYCFPLLVTSLLLLSPLNSRGDGSELLQRYFAPQSMGVDLSKIIRTPVFYQNKYNLFLFIAACGLWAFVWTDLWRTFLQLPLPTLVDQLYISYDAGTEVVLKGGQTFVYFLLLYPLLQVLYELVRASVTKNTTTTKVKINGNQLLTEQEQSLALSKVPLFVSLCEKDASDLFSQMDTKFFADGQYLVKQGQVGEEFYVVVRGRAVASFVDQSGNTHTVGRLQEGDAFGEVALIDSVPRTASISSDGGCFVVILQKKKFQAFIDQNSSAEAVKQMIRLSSFLKKHPLLSRLNAKDLANVIENLHYESVAPKERINPQLIKDNLYIVYSGHIAIETGDRTKNIKLGPEDIFGFSPFSPEGINGDAHSELGAGVLRLPKDIFLESIWGRFLNSPELLWDT
jgi:CRP-like cAMP-binding protein